MKRPILALYYVLSQNVMYNQGVSGFTYRVSTACVFQRRCRGWIFTVLGAEGFADTVAVTTIQLPLACSVGASDGAEYSRVKRIPEVVSS